MEKQTTLNWNLSFTLNLKPQEAAFLGQIDTIIWWN